MLNQLRFICSPKHYKIISFFVERVLEQYDQMYEKVTLYDFSIFGGGVALSDLQ